MSLGRLTVMPEAMKELHETISLRLQHYDPVTVALVSIGSTWILSKFWHMYKDDQGSIFFITFIIQILGILKRIRQNVFGLIKAIPYVRDYIQVNTIHSYSSKSLFRKKRTQSTRIWCKCSMLPTPPTFGEIPSRGKVLQRMRLWNWRLPTRKWVSDSRSCTLSRCLVCLISFLLSVLLQVGYSPCKTCLMFDVTDVQMGPSTSKGVYPEQPSVWRMTARKWRCTAMCWSTTPGRTLSGLSCFREWEKWRLRLSECAATCWEGMKRPVDL